MPVSHKTMREKIVGDTTRSEDHKGFNNKINNTDLSISPQSSVHCFLPLFHGHRSGLGHLDSGDPDKQAP